MDDLGPRLNPIRERMAGCRDCALAETRTQIVFGEGNPEAPLMIVGEGPGQQEDATGRPFVGRAGKLLDECLAENRIFRRHVFITNVVHCRACVIEGSSVRNRAPAPEEMAACRHWLEEIVDAVRPLAILCLGAPSANTIIHRGFRMLAERGTWFDTPYARCAMATLHPAYVLRQAGPEFERSRAMLVGDIEEARRKVAALRKEPQPPPTLF